MSGYTKLFSSIVHSTIWREPDHVRIVWITMLAIADRHGEVEASVPGLADLSRVSLEQCQDALRVLSSPDKFSRNQDYDGKRIVEILGGWALLNHDLYRTKLNDEEQREKDRERKARYRAKLKPSCNDVLKCPAVSRDVPLGHAESDIPDPDPNSRSQLPEANSGNNHYLLDLDKNKVKDADKNDLDLSPLELEIRNYIDSLDWGPHAYPVPIAQVRKLCDPAFAPGVDRKDAIQRAHAWMVANNPGGVTQVGRLLINWINNNKPKPTVNPHDNTGYVMPKRWDIAEKEAKAHAAELEARGQNKPMPTIEEMMAKSRPRPNPTTEKKV